jgi:RimJ/RimL family protein N-acetyltransferase
MTVQSSGTHAASAFAPRPGPTPDLIIRPFVTEDLDVAHAALDLGQDEPGMSLSERAAMTQYRITQLENDDGVGCYAIVERSSDRLIGYVGLQFNLLPGPTCATPEIELFYKLARSFRGRGYATQACRSMLGFAFGTLHLRRTVSVTERSNVRSVALLRRLGARITDHPTRAGLVIGIIDTPDAAGGG